MEIGDADDGNTTPGDRLAPDDARHDGEGGHRAVDAAIDPVSEIARSGPMFQPLGDVAGAVAMLKLAFQSWLLFQGP